MTLLDDYLAWLAADLDGLRAAGLLRRMRPGRGIDLVSNDYLGLAGHPHVREAMRSALAAGPVGAGGSRLLRGHHAAFERLEERLASFCGTGAALLFATGYAANVGLLQTLVGRDDVVLSDEHNHASLIDGIRLSGARKRIYRHNDLGALEEALSQPRQCNAFVVTESVFSMDGDLTPLAEIVALAESRGALVIVDEAHATGLYGPTGAGRVEELGLRERVLATVHTGGKALGAAGAWVAGPPVLRDVLVNRARTFVFSTAPLLVLVAALDAALDVVTGEPLRRAEVHRKARLLRDALVRQGAPVGGASAIVPLVVGRNEAAIALQEGLEAAGFDVRAVRPPTVPPGTARLRVTARYPVADADLMRFAAEVGRLLGEWAA
jgi:8-amino-7-oxononanoate synthase